MRFLFFFHFMHLSSVFSSNDGLLYVLLVTRQRVHKRLTDPFSDDLLGKLLDTSCRDNILPL